MLAAALHFTPALGAVAPNRERLLELAEGAARGADLLVLPELATTGFSLSPAAAADAAEPAEGPTFRALSALARAERCVIALGLCLRSEAGLHNAQLLIDSTGELAGVYRKHHLWGSDRDWALAGPQAGQVTSTRIGPVAQLICADIGYPASLASLRGRARLLAFSTNWVGDGVPVPVSWQVALRVFDPGWLIVANRGGEEEGVLFDDPSAILSYREGGELGPRGAASYVLRRELELE